MWTSINIMVSSCFKAMECFRSSLLVFQQSVTICTHIDGLVKLHTITVVHVRPT